MQWSLIDPTEPLYWHRLTSTPAWISNYIDNWVKDEINHPFQNFNGGAEDFWDWTIDLIPHLIESHFSIRTVEYQNTSKYLIHKVLDNTDKILIHYVSYSITQRIFTYIPQIKCIHYKPQASPWLLYRYTFIISYEVGRMSILVAMPWNQRVKAAFISAKYICSSKIDFQWSGSEKWFSIV